MKLEVTDGSDRHPDKVAVYLHFPDNLYPRGHCELGLLLLPPQQEVVVGEGVLAVHQLVHQLFSHLHDKLRH